MERQAFRYRDIHLFTLKIYACHQMKYALVRWAELFLPL